MNDFFDAKAPCEINLIRRHFLDGVKNFSQLDDFQLIEPQAMPRCRAKLAIDRMGG